MTLSTLSRTQVDLAGLMRLLANNLYSSPEVVIRELVQNGHDSCVRRRLEDSGSFEATVRVVPDARAQTLTLEDTGAGLTRDEIDRFLATVGTGYTGELRKQGKSTQLIGQFGIGFLSAYAVSEAVDLYTASFQTPEQAWHFYSAGGERYGVEPAEPRPVGTRVVLRLSDKYAFLSDPSAVEPLLEHYCCLLPVPILLVAPDGAAKEIQLTPPWRERDLSALRRKKRNLELAARFENQFEPICTFEVEPAHGGSARGLLWVQDGATYGTSDNRKVSVFVRGMLVSAKAKELLPDWAGFVAGVIEADALSPTASREDVQKDAAFSATAAQLREVLIEQLERVSREDPASWRRILLRHNEALLGAALCDPRLFELLSDVLKVPTSAGDLTVPAVRKRSQGKVHVSVGQAGGAEEVLFRALGVPVVLGTRYAALPFAAQHRRGTQDLVRLGTGEGNAALFRPAELTPAQRSQLQALFALDGVEVIVSRFAPDSLPLVLMPDRDVELKNRIEEDEADKRIGSAIVGLARAFTAGIDGQVRARLYVNVGSPLIARLLTLSASHASHLAQLLLAMGTLMSSRDELEVGLGTSEALSQFSSSVEALLAQKGS